MQVSDLAKGPLVTLELDDLLADVAREMEVNTVSAVVVCESGDLVGIITERDLVRAAADAVSFTDTQIEDYMTASPVTLPAAAPVEEALRLMVEGEFRHVPVLDDDGDVVGMLRLRDVARVLVPTAG